MKKNFITIKDLSATEMHEIFEQAEKLKLNREKHAKLLTGKTLGLIFEKPSNRTRVSFEVGMFELGGHAIYLGSDEIQLGEREAVKDAARVLSRYLDGIVARTFSHARLLELAEYASVPVINGLTDLFHPCQGLSDLFTIKEKKGLDNITLAFIGDANNVLNSLLYGCSKAGIRINVSSPKGYQPSKTILEDIGDIVTVFNNPKDAVRSADVIYTDVWTSMGQEKERKRRLKKFRKFQVNSDLIKLAKDNAIIMHCLPAHRGEEITDEVIDSKNSVVIDQAENRLHVQKAILVKLLNR